MINSQNKINIKVLWYLMPLIIVSFVISAIVLNKRTVNVFEEYPLIESCDALDVVVSGKDIYKGTTLITTGGEKKISIRAYNWDIKPNVLYYHLEIGDSISIKPFSDTLFLYKKKNGSVIQFECLE